MSDFEVLDSSTAGLSAPFAVADLGAFDTNTAIMRRHALGKPIRVASKSLRNRTLLRRVLRRPGYEGIMAFTLPEALWLSEEFDDILVAYPTTDTEALQRLARDDRATARITVTVDSIEHLEYLERYVAPSSSRPLRLCLDVDMSLRLWGGRIRVGSLRSPIHSAAEAEELAKHIDKRSGTKLVGVLAYEAQIAGVGDRVPGQKLKNTAVRALKRWSGHDVLRRRADIVERLSSFTDLEFVNGGGTGSLEFTASGPAVTEVAAGSGLYGPGLFDGYRSIRPCNAVHFALDVVRRPKPGAVTALGGGWIASGAPGKDRLPTVAHPARMRYTTAEGAGEVQTPLTGAAADDVSLGQRVWMRHAKAGELAERLNTFYLFDGKDIVDEAPTYRGEGKAFL